MQVDRLGPEIGAIDRLDRRCPQRIRRAADDEPLQGDFGGAARALGGDDRLPLLRGLRLRLHDVDRRHRADFDLGLVVPQQLVGEQQRLPRDVDRLHGEHVIPVRVAHVRDRVHRGLLQLDVGDVLVDARDEQLLPRRVDLEIAQQRLDVLRRPRRLVLRIDRGGQVRRFRAAIVERRRKIAAAPRHVLHEAAVEHERGVVDGRAGLPAGNRARRRVLRALIADERRHRRAVDRSDARDVDVEDLLADALDRDVEVVLERALHRVLERERHARSARIGWPHGQWPAGAWPAPACPAANTPAGNFRRV